MPPEMVLDQRRRASRFLEGLVSRCGIGQSCDLRAESCPVRQHCSLEKRSVNCARQEVLKLLAGCANDGWGG